MANVSDCGELRDKLWNLSDVNELFPWVPLFTWRCIHRSTRNGRCAPGYSFCCGNCRSLLYQSTVGRYCSAPAGSLGSHLRSPATESQITAAQKTSVLINTKKSVSILSNECVEGLVRVPKPTCSAPDVSHLPRKRAEHWLCQFELEVYHKDGEPYPSTTLYQLCCGILCYFFVNFTFPCTSVTSSHNGAWANSLIMSERFYSSSCSSPKSLIRCYSCMWMSVVDDNPAA